MGRFPRGKRRLNRGAEPVLLLLLSSATGFWARSGTLLFFFFDTIVSIGDKGITFWPENSFKNLN